MKKPDKKETINLFFSAFLILAFIVCAHFFTRFTSNLDATLGLVITIAIYVVFGLLVFYATRVGDGKPVKRFSVVTLVIMVLPALYILIASVANLPLHDVFASPNGSVSVITALAAVALGYGIPYTFISGFELAPENAEEPAPEVLEGGVEADVLAAGEPEEASEAPEEETAEESAEEPTEE